VIGRASTGEARADVKAGGIRALMLRATLLMTVSR
jgi:hypothetical protein